jgi:glycine cleavage system regulatory protein
MTHTIETFDPRLVARLINLAHRFGCSYTQLSAHRTGERYAATIEFSGPNDALERLTLQVRKLATEHEENF